MKTKLFVLGMTIGAIALVQPLGAADTKTFDVAVSATVSTVAKLTVNKATLTFPNVDPDTSASIAATEGAVTITAKARTALGSTVTLTLLAPTDLLNASGDAIAASNVTWAVTGAGFAAGALANNVAQTVASWVNSGDRTGTQTFSLANSWAHPTGTFTVTATYTLTAP